MTTDASKLLEEALKLPAETRATLAGSLLESLDEIEDEDVEDAWAAEVARQLHEIQTGKVRPVPWPEARRSIIMQ